MNARKLANRNGPVVIVLVFAAMSTAVAIGGADSHHGDPELAQAVVTMADIELFDPAQPLTGEAR